MNKRKLKLGINIALILLCLVCVGIFAYAYPRISRIKNAISKMEQDDIASTSEEPVDGEQDTGFWNIAFFGLDSRDADSLTTMNTSDYGDKRSDCIMIISINRGTGDVKLLSVYRDTYMQMRRKNYYESGEYIYDKATHAYFYGSANKVPGDESKDAGPYFSIDMLERNLDIEIDNFVSVNFGIVANVIDTLGGVELELTQAECKDINQYIDEINRITGSNSEHIVEPGVYQLDGVQATAYGRVRHTLGDDYKRAERQRTVMMLAAKKAQAANLDTLVSLVELVAPQLRTDLTTKQMLSLVNSVRKYNLDEENGQSGFPFNKKDDPSYVDPDDMAANVIALHQYLYGDTDYTPSDLVYEISNHIDEELGIYREGNDSDIDPYQREDYSSGSDDNYVDEDDGSSYSHPDYDYDESGSGDDGSGSYDNSGDDGSYDNSGDDGSGSYDNSGDDGSGGDGSGDSSSGGDGSGSYDNSGDDGSGGSSSGGDGSGSDSGSGSE